MTASFSYDLFAPAATRLGLIVLQSDETIEADFRQIIPAACDLLISRIPSGLEVTQDSLAQMEAHLPSAAGLFPRGSRFDAVGYGCTSGTAQIGADQIAKLVQSGCQADAVSEPVSALIAACNSMELGRIAILSPYIESVSGRLREVLAQHGIDTPVFGSFNEAEEAKVSRISARSIHDAALQLCSGADVDALFLSCTNLRSLPVIAELEDALGLPVLSSNQVLGWHLCKLAGLHPNRDGLGQLMSR